MSVNIENEYEKELSLDFKDIIRKATAEALRYEGCPFDCEINVLLTDDSEIEKMNEEYRDIKKSTDVLSFPMIEYSEPADFTGFEDEIELFDPDTGELVLGDIVVSMDHVFAQAEEYGHGPERELAFLVAHSMLHLMGYDHMEDEEREVMEKKQEEILTNCGYER